jgi:hypothetical protein
VNRAMAWGRSAGVSFVYPTPIRAAGKSGRTSAPSLVPDIRHLMNQPTVVRTTHSVEPHGSLEDRLTIDHPPALCSILGWRSIKRTAAQQYGRQQQARYQ